MLSIGKIGNLFQQFGAVNVGVAVALNCVDQIVVRTLVSVGSGGDLAVAGAQTIDGATTAKLAAANRLELESGAAVSLALLGRAHDRSMAAARAFVDNA